MTDPRLPRPRGAVSQTLLDTLRRPAGSALAPPPASFDPWSDDAQLALYACYELHYRGFADVDPAWEWDPGLIRVRAALEEAFLDVLRAGTGADEDAEAVLAPLLTEPDEGSGISHHLLRDGDLDQFREYVIHRSVYHLKEADPHALLIPRLTGRAKAAVVTVEFDEFGGGRAERMHATLFADLMRGLGLDDGYGHYLDRVPAAMLAVVNLMSTFGWHRGRRGMMVGHFAAAEISTPPSAARLARALDRLGVADPACALFYTEHVEADAVHEQLMRREVVATMLAEEPALEPDIVFGVQATELVEERFAEHVMTAWKNGRSSLLPPLA
ncbi:iron-containing redox enzyme family protein [Streptodolium elevatio]|uniref:Iron-containing redox enzyme family protein n=1 Tax=Streptodolium elevatio TaxID=3157996 RepID=A0ABV3DKE0_9ACTN